MRSESVGPVPAEPSTTPPARAGEDVRAPWEVAGGVPAVIPVSGAPPASAALGEIRSRVHRRLIERLNLSTLDTADRDQVVAAIRREVHDLITAEGAPLNFDEREALVGQILDEIFGLGPLEPLIQDADVTDILVNTFDSVFVERHGKLYFTDVRFQDDRHLLQIIDRIVSAVGRRIDESSPMVDARLLDGSRVHAIIPPLALDSPTITIRKFPKKRIIVEDLIQFGSLSEPMANFLRICVLSVKNMVISGGTGSGKTTLLNVLGSFI